MLDQMEKESLGKILRFVHRIAASTHETIQGRPISLAKLPRAAWADPVASSCFPAARTTLQRVGSKQSFGRLDFVKDGTVAV